MQLRHLTISLLTATVVGLSSLTLRAQTDSAAKSNSTAKPAKAAAAEKASPSRQLELNDKQRALASRYQRFEKTMLQMAEYLRKTDPERADLLIRAIRKSKGTRITQQMQQISKLLENSAPQFGEALSRQEVVVGHLKAILQLLQSEDQRERNKKEQARIKDIIRDLKKIIGKEKDVRAGTERGDDADDLARRQKKVAEDAKRLVGKIDNQDADRSGKPSDGKPSDGKPSDGKPSDGKPSDGKPKDGKPKDGKPKDGKPKDGKPKDGKPKDGKPSDGKPSDGKPSDGKPSDGKPSDGKPSDGKPSDGKPSDGKPSDGKPSDSKPSDGKPSDSDEKEKTAGRDEIEKARQEMERAIEELKKQKLENATGHEDEAIRQLMKAKEKLEEILRQLREEERELLLAALEARFQKMLAMQKLVLSGTLGLNRTKKKDWQPRHEGRSRELAVQEDDIAVEAAKALTLLKEEGSSVAFPEAVEQLREDMQAVSRRLREYQVAQLTQGIELDIIEALEEIIEALQKEMEKNEKKKQQQQQQQGQQQDPPLVDKLAELKMLRSLQLGINRRTRRLGRLFDGEQATEGEIIDQLKLLAKRQARIQQATYDLATGKNK